MSKHLKSPSSYLPQLKAKSEANLATSEKVIRKSPSGSGVNSLKGTPRLILTLTLTLTLILTLTLTLIH
jgi:hypothetical protein